MKLLKQILKDLNLSELEAIKILYKKKTSKKTGRPKSLIKYIIFTKVSEILQRKKTISVKSACEIYFKSSHFNKSQKLYGSNIQSSKRIYNLYLESKSIDPKYFSGIVTLLK